MSPRRSISVPVAGGELSVEVTGPAPHDRAPVVVLLHDLAANAVTWRLVATRLDPTMAAFAFDRRGRAASGALPGPFGVRADIADVIALLDHVGAGRCVVVGHGTGAVTATNLAAHHPDRIVGVVLVDGGLPIEVLGDRHAVAEATLLPILGRLRSTHRGRELALAQWRRHDLPPGVADALYDDAILHDLGGAAGEVRSRTNELAVWCEGSEILLDATVSSAVERIDVPVELLRADPQTAPPATARVVIADPDRLAQRLVHLSVLTVPGLDHEMLLFHPQGADAVARSVMRVVARAQV